MLHKFVAASQAQSRSWKTYMKRLKLILKQLIIRESKRNNNLHRQWLV